MGDTGPTRTFTRADPRVPQTDVGAHSRNRPNPQEPSLQSFVADIALYRLYP